MAWRTDWLALLVRCRILVYGLIGSIFLYSGIDCNAENSRSVEVETGSSVVLNIPHVQRIAVGNSQILQATEINGKEIVVFGKAKGLTTLDVWIAGGKRISHVVQVTPAGLNRVYREITVLLKSIPNARSAIVGEKVVIEGEDLGDLDQAKISRLAARYPEVIDLTSQIGWDRMVLLDVQVIEIPSSRMHELGVRWDPSAQGGLQAGMAWDVHSAALDQRPGEAALNVPFPLQQAAGYLGLNALLNARIAALSKNGEAVVLAQPQLLARSGSTASFLAGGEVPYASVDKDGKSTTTFKKYGVSLNITPNVDRHSAVRSKIEIEVSSVDTTINVPGGPAMKIRKASTEFNVRSGQTLVLGGFLSREKSSDQDGLPGLSRIPVLGKAFGVEREISRQTELAIFVTPVVVDAQHPEMLARISNGQKIVSEAFPEPPRLNHPIAHSQSAPYSGAASQWETVDQAAQQGRASQWESSN